MAVLYGAYTAPRATTPQGLLDGSVQGGHVRVFREKIALSGQTIADTIVLAFPSAGETFLSGTITSDVTLGVSQVSVGTVASSAKYRPLGTHTVPDMPTNFGRAAAQSAKLVTDETIVLTIATASLPVTGTLIIDLYFAQS